jgi:hypothetical protein
MKYRLKAASGALTGQTFGLAETTRIGSAPDAHIRINGLGPEHARIVQRDGGLWLEADGECLINGEAVHSAALQSGDELRFGTVRLVLQAPGLKPARVLDRPQAAGPGHWRWALYAGLASIGAAAAAWWWLAGRAVE